MSLLRALHWYRLGVLFRYPACCIGYMCSTADVDTKHNPARRAEHSVFYGTGFIPCPACCEHTSEFTQQEATSWLGRDLFNIYHLRNIHETRLDS